MAVYRYQGIRSGNGKKVDGLLEADSERDARRELRQQGIYATSIELSRKAASTTSWRRWLRFERKLASSERVVFTHQLAGMLEAGFPLIEALQLVQEQLDPGTLKDATIAIRNDVSEGRSLSQALEEYPAIFSPFYTNLVRAGEASGALEVVLKRLASSLEARQQLRDKLVSAMIYPAIMIIASIGVLVFLMTVVVPNVVQLFADSEQSLPLITRILITTSDLLVNWWWLWLGLLGGGLITVAVLWQREAWRQRIDRWLLKLPLVRQIHSQRITATLGLLLDSGVTILPALEVSSKVTGSAAVQNALSEVGVAVAKGQGLSDALRATGLFTNLALRLVHAGETAGNLEAMLGRIADNEEAALRRTLERFMGLLEPLIVLAMGLVVGFVAIAVMLPIFEMNQLIQ